MSGQAIDDLPPEPHKSNIPYYSMSFKDKAVQQRIKVWKQDPITFCKEAMNWHPHWYQEALLTDQSIYISACWSRQLGKSDTVAHKAIYVALTEPDSEVIIIAPTKRQAGMLYEKILKTVNRSKLIKQAVSGRPTSEKMKFTNGSKIISVPAGDDGDNIRGYSIALLIIDEAAFVPAAVFTAVEQGLSSTGGKLIMISTPRGKHNEFYKCFFPVGKRPFDMSKNGRQNVGNYSCHRYDHTVGYNVFKPNGDPQLSEFHVNVQMEKMGGENSWKFRAEYKAEFVEDIDAYWEQELIDRMFRIEFDSLDESESDDKTYYMAIDIAKNRDKTGLVVGERIDINPITGKPLVNPHIRIVFAKYWVDGGIEKQYPKILAAIKLFKPRAIYFDKTALGERPFEELQITYKLVDIIEGVIFQSKVKISIYGTLTHLMAAPAEIDGWKSRIQCFYDQKMKDEFGNIVYELPTVTTAVGGKRDSSMSYIYAGQGNDDMTDAVAMLTMCLGTHTTEPYLETVSRDFTDEPQADILERTIFKATSVKLDRGRGRNSSRSSKIFWDTSF